MNDGESPIISRKSPTIYQGHTEMLTLEELAAVLSAHPHAALNLMLPNQTFVPAHFHVTEVGRVQKDFMDCGGTVRNSSVCVLQVWVANDTDHRLESNKLAKIVQKGMDLFGLSATPVEIEYDDGVISQYPLEAVRVSSSGIVLQLGTKHTACLAQERCDIRLDVLSACSTPGCC